MSDHSAPAQNTTTTTTTTTTTPTPTPTPTAPVTVTAAHLGTATVLLRIGDLTVLTDPALDPGPADYPAARPLRRTAGPALAADQLPPIDLVLLSHDQHADNLDPTGRTVLARATTVLTTPEAAERLGGAAEGLATWESRRITAGATTVTVTATPARHGPPGTEEATGPVTGFVVEYEGGTLYLSGDTVRHDALAGIAERFAVDTAFLHLGDAHFPSTGDRAFSMSAREGAELARLLGARTVVPVHYESWEHLGEDPAAITGAFSAPDLTGRLRLLTPGVAESL
ncbi:MBL fold metallo-hydrolase [Kitasatospora purpeofusca]|uniref:MBL fold metallo-hydrolase n=1 Tax=Kitasatospora purpeofusca TaxID=67352 RepID=UPI00224DEFD4|nr:MBL fold metallo-hydrolase [Kitasatospora purpeofusca]MCX4755779.1 MBL fold metallo-hydrolase [Kitasatospora purpeofusca]WSR36362.1 MBL fold metallo-hydrolase [Kitasatospora purpeofusca]WSR44650.1 MBL fold metallo-hydrolase [Kitasatospora purpeofusca]